MPDHDLMPLTHAAMREGISADRLRRLVQRRLVEVVIQDGRYYVTATGLQQLHEALRAAPGADFRVAV